MRKRTGFQTEMGKTGLGFQAVTFLIVTLFAVLCLLPFVLLVTGSITSEKEIIRSGYAVIPKEVSFRSYQVIFENPQEITNAYAVTICVTAVGTVSALFLTSMTGYVLARQDFKYRNFFSLLFFFTSLFIAPLVVDYVYTVTVLKLKNNPLVYILGGLLHVWYVLIMRNFIKGLPDSIVEAAKIDGANDFYIYARIVLPLMKPVLATVGLFTALGYWNDWATTMLYIETPRLYNLQYYLYRIMNSTKAIERMIAMGGTSLSNIELPTQGIKLAMAVVSIGPIILLYPFLQKYFVQGLTIGAVKG